MSKIVRWYIPHNSEGGRECTEEIVSDLCSGGLGFTLRVFM